MHYFGWKNTSNLEKVEIAVKKKCYSPISFLPKDSIPAAADGSSKSPSSLRKASNLEAFFFF